MSEEEVVKDPADGGWREVPDLESLVEKGSWSDFPSLGELFRGLSSPRSSGAYRRARLALERLQAPVIAVVAPLVVVAALFIVTATVNRSKEKFVIEVASQQQDVEDLDPAEEDVVPEDAPDMVAVDPDAPVVDVRIRLDIGGSFAEFHPIDFERDTVLVGHDGPHHLNIAQAKPVLRSLKKYHGKPGKGAGVEFNIKEGPITMMSIGLKADGTFKFVVAEGESLKGPIPPTGNTNTHGKFLPDVRTFLRRWTLAGPTHHFSLGVGHHAAELKKLGKALGVEVEVVTPER